MGTPPARGGDANGVDRPSRRVGGGGRADLQLPVTCRAPDGGPATRQGREELPEDPGGGGRPAGRGERERPGLRPRDGGGPRPTPRAGAPFLPEPPRRTR